MNNRNLFITLVFLILILGILSSCTSKEVQGEVKENNVLDTTNNQQTQVEEEEQSTLKELKEQQGEENIKSKEKDEVVSDIIVTKMYFMGKSDNWYGQLTDYGDWYNFNIHYIIDEPESGYINKESIGVVQCRIATQNKTIERKAELVGNSIPITSKDIPLPSEDDIITVTVMWNDNEEIFIMKNKLQENGVISSEEALKIAKQHMEINSVDMPIIEVNYIHFFETWKVLARDKNVADDYYFVQVHAKTGEIVLFEGRKGKQSFYGPK